jgi:hypothetical protein
MRYAPPLSHHLLLELEAVQAGRELQPGAPVPRCGCEACTGIPEEAVRTHHRDLRRGLDVDAARGVPITVVARSLGIVVNRAGWALCPFHEDRHPSLHLNDRKGAAFCNPCGRSWDPIALLMELGNMTFVDAVRDLTERNAA